MYIYMHKPQRSVVKCTVANLNENCFLRLLLSCPLQGSVYQKIVHHGEASEMENCGNSPKHIRIILVDQDDM